MVDADPVVAEGDLGSGDREGGWVEHLGDWLMLMLMSRLMSMSKLMLLSRLMLKMMLMLVEGDLVVVCVLCVYVVCMLVELGSSGLRACMWYVFRCSADGISETTSGERS